MGALQSHENRWVFPIKEAVRQVVPPEYTDDTLEDINDEDAAVARSIEISAALSANKQPQPGTSSEHEFQNQTSHQANKTILKFYRFFSDWLPRLTMGPAIAMLILNIFLPGLGTMIFSAKWLSPEDFIIPTTKAQRSSIVCTCLLYGFMQLLLAPFIFGWIWAITTGVLAVQQARWVAISETYSHVIEQRLKDMLREKTEIAREHGRHIQRLKNSSSTSDDNGPIADVTPSAIQANINGNQGGLGASFFHQEAPAHIESPPPAMRPKPHTNASSEPIMTNKRRNNDIHPSSTDGLITTAPTPSSLIADNEVFESDPQNLSRSSSRQSSRKSTALSLSLNRISPAPTPAGTFSVPTRQQTPSPQNQNDGEHADTKVLERPSSHGSKTVTFSRSLPSRESAKRGAWASDAPEPEKKPSPPEPASTAGDNIDTMYGNVNDADSSGDEVIEFSTNYKSRPASSNSNKKSNDLAVEDI